MNCSTKPLPSMFWAPVVDLRIDGHDLYKAMEIATKIAQEHSREALMLAWYDERGRTFSPKVECCSEEMPGWLVYAKSRGGNLIVNINDGEFIFVFALPDE